MCKYILINKIGKGAFGNIYTGKRDNKIFAVKYQKKYKYSFYNEWNILKSLQSLDCVPKIDIFGVDEDNYTYFGMDMLKCTIISHYDYLYNMGKLKRDIIINLFVDMISVLRSVHSCGVLHGDLKPENFMFDDNMKMKLIDFGLSKFYLIDNKHIAQKHVSQTTGSIIFMSLNNHSLMEISRRDDLIALFYNFVSILLNRLPWSHCTSSRNVIRLKKIVKIEDLCDVLNNKFLEMYEYINSLQFYEDPDYDYLINILKNIDKIYK